MPVLKLYGPPGTGKTTELLRLMEKELLDRVPIDRIAFVTFTRAAQREAITRSGHGDKFVLCRTLHSLAYRQLRVNRGQMITPLMLRAWGKESGVELSGYVPDPLAEDMYGETTQPTLGDRLLGINHLGRHRGVGLKAMLSNADDPDLTLEFSTWFTEAYRQWKHRENLLDYTDLLTAYLDRGNPLDCEVFFIDEGQDLSRLQWRVAHKASSRARQVYIAGDDDQSIYGWAGASADLFNNYPCDEERVLGQSWRCPRPVMDLAQGIIGQVETRHAKTVLGAAHEGEVGDASNLDCAPLDGESTLVLYRHHMHGRRLAKDLKNLGVPYAGHGSPLGDGGKYQGALGAWRAWERGTLPTLEETRYALSIIKPEHLLIRDTERPLTGVQAVKNFRVGMALDTMPNLPDRYWVSRCLAAEGWDKVVNPTVSLKSIHQSKGGEADTVILDTGLTRRSWDGYLKEPDDEHRVFYVGVTRARRRLVRLMPQGVSYPL